MSRVYLYMDNNNKALEYANKVINSGRYVLVPSSELPTYAGKVPEQNTETIFAFKFENNPNMYSSDYALGSMYIQINGQGWGEMYAADPYVRQLEMFPTDLRNKFIEKTIQVLNLRLFIGQNLRRIHLIINMFSILQQ